MATSGFFATVNSPEFVGDPESGGAASLNAAFVVGILYRRVFQGDTNASLRSLIELERGEVMTQAEINDWLALVAWIDAPTSDDVKISRLGSMRDRLSLYELRKPDGTPWVTGDDLRTELASRGVVWT